MNTDPYIESILRQRTAREKRLLANPRNWFSLIGLYPLTEGKNTLGSKQRESINVPELPEEFSATIKLNHGEVSLFEGTSALLVNGKTAELRALGTDRNEVADVLSVGDIHMVVIQRGERFFLRAWNLQASAARDFSGLNYFPVDPAWKITAQFTTFPLTHLLTIEDVVGTRYESKFTGRATFTIGGAACSLIAEEDDEELLFSFTDLTKADSTYPGGRFITTALPEYNKVVLDFNLSKNWPCAYTPHATCPLPPFENHLKVHIEAGEKRYATHH